MDDTFDLIVVGGGGAGREAATRAHLDHGASVAVVEDGLWGGSCANVACKPTKQLVTAATLFHDLREVGADLGIQTGELGFSLAALKARKDWLVGTQESWRQRFVDLGFTAIDGVATFEDANTVRVGEHVLSSERILVSTGSRTAVPPVDGIAGVPWIDHIGALELTELPPSLLVLGAGAVGLELAQVFSRFGSHVTIVEAASRIAGRADGDAAAALHTALEAEGVEIVTDTFVTRVATRDRAPAITATLTPRNGAAERIVEADVLLVASGRRPNVERLALDRVGVETTRAGIVVDERMRTSTRGIWAAGDVAAGIQLTPVAAYQAQVAVADMFDGSRTTDYSLVPTSIFTDPELASVGLTEEEARDRGIEIETAAYAGSDILRHYYTLPRDAVAFGLVKLVFERGSRRLLGLHAVVRGGGEVVQGWALALARGVTLDDIVGGHYAFPTVGEAVHYAAEAALTPTPVA
jgi:pyruvate/2-oxoglutarate dehydrogenase complex dihydrolipoamide dehydrogenase (E3) component